MLYFEILYGEHLRGVPVKLRYFPLGEDVLVLVVKNWERKTSQRMRVKSFE